MNQTFLTFLFKLQIKFNNHFQIQIVTQLYIVFYNQSSSLPVPSAIPVTLPFVVYAGTFGCTEFHRVSRSTCLCPFFVRRSCINCDRNV